jgi:hypothetical protein
MKPDTSDASAYRAYAVISNAIHKAVVDRGGLMLLSERERIAQVIWDELAAHNVKIEGLPPRCEHVDYRRGRCKLALGHPVGPMYNFHPDVADGHMFEDR